MKTLILAATLLFAGCANDTRGVLDVSLTKDTSFASPWGAPDVVQTRITADPAVAAAWIPGTSQAALLIKKAGRCVINVFDAATSTLQEAGPAASCWSSIYATADRHVYYVDEDCYGRAIIDRVDLVAQKVETVLQIEGGWCAQSFAVSADGRRIVYGSASPRGFGYSDVLNHTTKVIADFYIETAFAQAVGISADGSEGYYLKSIPGNSNEELHRVNLVSGVDDILSKKAYLPPLSWTAAGVQYIQYVGGTVSAVLANATTGDTFNLRDSQFLSWSENGSTVFGVAYWCDSFGCPHMRADAVIGNWTSKKQTVVAREDCKLFANGPTAAVSADGSTVVYGLCSGTYVYRN